MIFFESGWSGVIRGYHDDAMAKHLMSLGLMIGKQLTIIGKSPFGNTFRVQIDHRSIALREIEILAINFVENN